MGQERFSLSRKELKRYTVVNQVMDKKLTTKEAAELLDISTRQVFRLKKKIALEGETGIIHKNRGRKPAHAISDEMKETIINLYSSHRYHNCNDYHLTELLAKHEGIENSPSTVRRIRYEAQIKPKTQTKSPSGDAGSNGCLGPPLVRRSS